MSELWEYRGSEPLMERLARLEQQANQAVVEWSEAQARIAELTTERDALREALETYAVHLGNCNGLDLEGGGCTCGLDALLAAHQRD